MSYQCVFNFDESPIVVVPLIIEEPVVLSVEPVVAPLPTIVPTIFEIMDKLEQEGMDKVQQYAMSVKNTDPLNGNVFLKIMETGAQEFKEKVGRNMTYSEMRRMYG